MRKKSFFVLAFALVFVCQAFTQNTDSQDYIKDYKKIAVKEMERTGIPASIKLAQALLESAAGKSELARKANNHFGIKCHNDWSGKTYQIEDDDYDDSGNLKKSCFRKYKSAEDSYIAHSEFLRDPRKENRYGFLFRLNPTDYKRWAKGLRTSGYATGAGYDGKLIRIIETYKLYELDRLSEDNFPEGRPDRPKDAIAGLDLRRVNDVKVVFAKNKITVQEISDKTGVSLKRLERYNDQLPAIQDSLADNTRIYIQPKRCNFRGRKWHYVQKDDTMFSISQLYGVKVNQLRKRNRIPENAELQLNQRIKLKGFRIKKGERPRLNTEPKPAVTVPADDGFMQDEDISPDPGSTPVTPSTTKPDTTDTDLPSQPDQPVGAVYHTVEKGDTLYNISRRYGIPVDDLKRLNNMADNTIKIGQVLRVK
ncbi:MAG: LysM peptidoglycan-binding domain-containing protein [Bacteroidetes bacterium]|nr:LysM peptidoglycan-binding domain-containing protein [Bacteroidota bacterium]